MLIPNIKDIGSVVFSNKDGKDYAEILIHVQDLEVVKSSNINVIKCYNLVFDFSNKSNNFGFWIFLLLLLLIFICDNPISDIPKVTIIFWEI